MDVRHEVIAIATPIAEEMGFELVDVELVSQGRWTLRVFIERLPGAIAPPPAGVGPAGPGAGGVTIDDLQRMSRRLDDALEMNQTLPHRYVLEVSSPGIERRLRTPEHFRRYLGSRVFVQTHELVEGRRRVEGGLEACDDSTITVVLDEGGRWSVPIAAVQKAHLVVDPWAEVRAAQAREGGSGAGKERPRRSGLKEKS
jgi:ribosome maturation factor RimP